MLDVRKRCDHCGEEINGSYKIIWAEMGEFTEGKDRINVLKKLGLDNILPDPKRHELCMTCYNKLVEYCTPGGNVSNDERGSESSSNEENQ